MMVGFSDISTEELLALNRRCLWHTTTKLLHRLGQHPGVSSSELLFCSSLTLHAPMYLTTAVGKKSL